jgi:hypothetical protein
MGSVADAIEAPPSVRFDVGGVKVFRRDEASSYGWWGNIAVVLGRQPPSASHVVNYRACVIDLSRRFPQGVGLITVVNDTSTPGPGGREAMIAMFREVWPQLRAALFVPNATGFKAAVIRSVMGGFILASGQRDRIRVETSVHAGMPWLAAKVLGAAEGAQRLAMLERGVMKFCETETSYPDSAGPKSR